MSKEQQNSQSAQQVQAGEKSQLQEIQQEVEVATQGEKKNLGDLFGLENVSPLVATASGGSAVRTSKQHIEQQLNAGAGILTSAQEAVERAEAACQNRRNEHNAGLQAATALERFPGTTLGSRVKQQLNARTENTTYTLLTKGVPDMALIFKQGELTLIKNYRPVVKTSAGNRINERNLVRLARQVQVQTKLQRG